MSDVYFAKFNINEEIYEVYSDKTLLEKLLFKIYTSLRTDLSINDGDGTYKFTTLDKNPDTLVINGRLVKYGPGTHISYDEDADDIIETLDEKKASYITFCFDVQNEIIGFVPKRDFGHKQFLQRFKRLIEASSDIGEVQLFLETDTDKLEERIKFLEKVNEITVRLIPPNDDKEDFKALFGTEADDVEDSGATRFIISLFASATKTIKVSSKYVQNLLKAVGLGYGQMSVRGVNRSGEKVRIRSEQDTPYTRSILDLNKDSIPEISEKTRAGISELKGLKARRRVIKSDESGYKE